MTRERYKELMKMPFLGLCSEEISNEEYLFVMYNCEKDINEITFEE